jgi:predicted Fe-Mo cluster-binding NifX family protein
MDGALAGQRVAVFVHILFFASTSGLKTGDLDQRARPAYGAWWGRDRQGEKDMKIAVPTADWATISGHAGKARYWLLYDLSEQRDGPALPPPVRIELTREQLPHYFKDDGPHPLDGVEIVLAGSAGDGFIRHMKKRGTDVLLTGETDPAAALALLVKGEALPDQRFDITTSLCKLRDLFSRH